MDSGRELSPSFRFLFTLNSVYLFNYRMLILRQLINNRKCSLKPSSYTTQMQILFTSKEELIWIMFIFGSYKSQKFQLTSVIVVFLNKKHKKIEIQIHSLFSSKPCQGVHDESASYYFSRHSVHSFWQVFIFLNKKRNQKLEKWKNIVSISQLLTKKNFLEIWKRFLIFEFETKKFFFDY